MSIFSSLKTILLNMDDNHRDKHESFLKRKELFELKRQVQIRELKRDVDVLFMKERKNLQALSAVRTEG